VVDSVVVLLVASSVLLGRDITDGGQDLVAMAAAEGGDGGRHALLSAYLGDTLDDLGVVIGWVVIDGSTKVAGFVARNTLSAQ
jgi:hypothetical protein